MIDVSSELTPVKMIKADSQKRCVRSLGGQLLKEMGCRAAIVYLDNDDVIQALETGGRLTDWFEFEFDD